MPINFNQIQHYSKLELLAKQVVEGFITGLHKSPFHGFSVEFAEHRLYNTGETTRHIDWKLFGRTEKLFVKRYEEETNLRCQLVIDTSSSMWFDGENNENKITFTIHAAAALIQLLKQQRDAIGLSLFNDNLSLHTPAKSSSLHLKMLYHELEKLLQPYNNLQQKKTYAAKALHQIADQIHKRSLVIIFSDMFDYAHNPSELYAALQHLKHNKNEVILFHVNNKKKELDFNFENRPHTFIDMESGEELKLNPTEIKESYLTAMNSYLTELKLKCAQYKIEFVEANINEGLNPILMTYLVKRAKII
ncbi:MAG: DUF58 domain-containing protein [Bacteroidota bacterium]